MDEQPVANKLYWEFNSYRYGNPRVSNKSLTPCEKNNLYVLRMNMYISWESSNLWRNILFVYIIRIIRKKNESNLSYEIVQAK